MTLQGSALTSSMVPPSVSIDGYRVPASYGQNTFPIPPGPHRVEIYIQWWRKYGRAVQDFTAQPGQTVPVFYRAPLTMFSPGRIGFEPQKAAGVVGLVVTLAVIALLIIGGIVLAALAG